MKDILILTVQLPEIAGDPDRQELTVHRDPPIEGLAANETINLEGDTDTALIEAFESQHLLLGLTAFDAAGHASVTKNLRTQARDHVLTYADEMIVVGVRHADEEEISVEDATGETAASMATCRVCGCTQDNCSQCIAATDEPCHWVEVPEGEAPLCSRCADEIKAKAKADGTTEGVAEVRIRNAKDAADAEATKAAADDAAAPKSTD